jgi:polysaccharide biosynthesis protein PslH
MRVLAVSTWCPTPVTNGSKFRVFQLLRELCRREYRVRLLTFAGPGDDPTGGELATLCESVEAVAGDPFVQGSLGWHGLLSPRPRSIAQTFNPEMAALVRARLAECDAAIAFQVPVVEYLLHATIPVMFEEAEIGRFWDAAYLTPRIARRLRARATLWKTAHFLRRLTDRVTRTTVASARELQYLTRIGCDARRLVIVPNGVPAADLAVDVRPERSTLIYPGAITYDANLDAMRFFVQHVWPRIRNARPDARLAITGATNEQARAALPLPEGITLTGPLADVRTAIARSRACVVPLRTGGGTRLKIVQAMAVGTPVVSTAKGVEGLDLTSGEDVLVADDPARFADHVVRLIDDDRLHDALARRGRALVRRAYTSEAAGRVLAEVLEQAIADAVGPSGQRVPWGAGAAASAREPAAR